MREVWGSRNEDVNMDVWPYKKGQSTKWLFMRKIVVALIENKHDKKLVKVV